MFLLSLYGIQELWNSIKSAALQEIQVRDNFYFTDFAIRNENAILHFTLYKNSSVIETDTEAHCLKFTYNLN